DFSFEAHPANTTLEHLQTLYDKGFRRLSIGVQDFNPGILTLINRRQTRQDVFRVVEQARSIGYRSINFDLIFGLPRQRPLDIEFNTEQVALLKPERIAFYSYAHVPWVKPSQRAYSEADLPTACQKRALYELGKQRLEAIGYREIGLDHFALPDDELFRARQHGTLHRNFMGYTPRPSRLLIGLGASSIGDTWDAYAQNEKHVEAYQQRVAAGELPLVKGHLLSPEEQIIRRHILNLMCLFHTSWQDPSLRPPNLERVLQRLEEPARDGLLLLEENGLRITPEGRPFVRNICLAFDFHFWEKRPQEQLFSKVV
ncbi:MAG: coproporphyrinogen dehydrogenase, partial [Bacteroidetes bacterium]